jgi:PhnB protein
MQVHPYVFFNGNCEAALNFYRDVLGAETQMLVRYSEAPDQGMCPPGSEHKIMHARIQIGESIVMLSDDIMQGEFAPKGFSLSIGMNGVEEAQRTFEALSAGGQVQMPFGKTFWSSGFGMLKDKFGVAWMVNVTV